MGVIEDLISRLTDVFAKETDSNNYLLLSIDAAELEEIYTMLQDVLNAHFVGTATGNDLDNVGELIGCPRRWLIPWHLQREDDASYRERLKARIGALIGGGAIPQIKATIIALFDNLTEDDIEIVDDYTTSSHGDPSHYAHFKVLIYNRAGDDWPDWPTLMDEIDKVKGAGITHDSDESGPAFLETQPSIDTLEVFDGLYFNEVQPSTETFSYVLIPTTWDESCTANEDEDLLVHRADITFTNSLNTVK